MAGMTKSDAIEATYKVLLNRPPESVEVKQYWLHEIDRRLGLGSSGALDDTLKTAADVHTYLSALYIGFLDPLAAPNAAKDVNAQLQTMFVSTFVELMRRAPHSNETTEYTSDMNTTWPEAFYKGLVRDRAALIDGMNVRLRAKLMATAEYKELHKDDGILGPVGSKVAWVGLGSLAVGAAVLLGAYKWDSRSGSAKSRRGKATPGSE